MKSIIYLSLDGDRPCKPVLVEHPADLPAFEILNRDPRFCNRLGLHYFGWRYAGTIMPSMSIHEKINHRAEFISHTTWHIWPR